MKHLHPYWHDIFRVEMYQELSIFKYTRNYYHINMPSITKLNIIYDI